MVGDDGGGIPSRLIRARQLCGFRLVGLWAGQLTGRLLLLLLALDFCIAGMASTAARGQTAADPATSPEGKTALEEFQNVQVLKEIPADQLVPAMQFITYALGV